MGTAANSNAPWASRAACRAADPALFGDPTGQADVDRDRLAAARSICARCPVADECLTDALAAPELSGVWAGTTGDDRQRALAATDLVPASRRIDAARRKAQAAVPAAAGNARRPPPVFAPPVPLSPPPGHPSATGPAPTQTRSAAPAARPVTAVPTQLSAGTTRLGTPVRPAVPVRPGPRPDPAQRLAAAAAMVLAGRGVQYVADLSGIPMSVLLAEARRMDEARRAAPRPVWPRPPKRAYRPQVPNPTGEVTFVVKVAGSVAEATRLGAAAAGRTVKEHVREALCAIADGRITDGLTTSDTEIRQVGTCVQVELREQAKTAAAELGIPLKSLVAAALLNPQAYGPPIPAE